MTRACVTAHVHNVLAIWWPIFELHKMNFLSNLNSGQKWLVKWLPDLLQLMLFFCAAFVISDHVLTILWTVLWFISMAYRKTAVTPLLMHCSYYNLALSHQNDHVLGTIATGHNNEKAIPILCGVCMMVSVLLRPNWPSVWSNKQEIVQSGRK